MALAWIGTVALVAGTIMIGTGVFAPFGVPLAIIGFIAFVVGANLCMFGPVGFCSTGSGTGGVVGTARGEDEVLDSLGLADEAAVISLPLQHVPQTNAEAHGVVAATNEMVDAYNRLQSDIRDGQELGGALAGVRLSIEKARTEIGRHEAGGYRVKAADLATARLRMQTEGMHPVEADYLRGCGYSEAAQDALLQRHLQADLSPGEGKSVVELLDEAAEGVPDASEFPKPGPLTPVPDPGVNR